MITLKHCVVQIDCQAKEAENETKRNLWAIALSDIRVMSEPKSSRREGYDVNPLTPF